MNTISFIRVSYENLISLFMFVLVFFSPKKCVVMLFLLGGFIFYSSYSDMHINTLRTGDADLRFYITTVQDG